MLKAQAIMTDSPPDWLEEDESLAVTAAIGILGGESFSCRERKFRKRCMKKIGEIGPIPRKRNQRFYKRELPFHINFPDLAF